MRKSNKKVKIIHESGKTKEVLEHIAHNARLMRNGGWEIFDDSVQDVPPIKDPVIKKPENVVEETNHCDLSAFKDGEGEFKNLKKTIELIESGDYDDCLQELYDEECNNANRKGAKTAIEERQKTK